MEKVEKTFIGFIFSLNNISLTLLVNFTAWMFYYALVHDGMWLYGIGGVWIVGATIITTIIYAIFWFLSYIAFKEKKNNIVSIEK